MISTIKKSHKINKASFSAFLGLLAVLCLAATLFAQNEKISIRLEIFCDGQLQPMEAQQWGRELNSLGFQSVQVRAGASTDVLDIQPLGDGYYRAVGMLTRNGRLMLAGEVQYSLSQVHQVKPYLEEQIRQMEQSQQEEKQSREESLKHDVLFRDLAAPVGFSTKGLSRRKVLQRLSDSFELKVKFPSSIKKELDPEDLVTEELENLSRGSALVYVLRYLGYCVEPVSEDSGSKMYLQVVRAEQADAQKILSVGYAAKRSDEPDSMNESFNANVEGASAQEILDSLQGRLEIPFLYDYNSMAGQGIDLNEETIHQKPGKFTYRRLIDAVLYKVSLQREVRMDEAGNVFFWITTLKR